MVNIGLKEAFCFPQNEAAVCCCALVRARGQCMQRPLSILAEMRGGGEATVVLSPPRGGKANERRPAGRQEQEGLAKVAMANPR